MDVVLPSQAAHMYAELTISTKDIPPIAVDLRENAKRLYRVFGSRYWIELDEIRKCPATIFFLHREPDNQHDKNAIAVYGGTRKFGYLAATAAAKYAPLLDRMGSHFIVRRDYEGYTGDGFYLPSLPVLRKLVEGEEFKYWRSKRRDIHAQRQPVTLPTPDKDLTGGYPRVEGPYSNGDQIFGLPRGYDEDLSANEPFMISWLKKTSITSEIQKVRIGDRLTLTLLDKKLVASKSGQEIGVLDWKWHKDFPLFDEGTLEVHRVTISIDGTVSHCEGRAKPSTFTAS